MPVFATAGAMVIAALKEIGALSEGAVASGEMMNAGLAGLNLLIDELSIDRNMVTALTEETFTLTVGTGSYEVKSGSLTGFATVPPVKIEHAFTRNGTEDLPVDCRMTEEEYAAIPDKTVTGRPERLFYKGSRPTAYVYFDNVPDAAYVLHAFMWKTLTSAVLVSGTALSFPTGYEAALFDNLCIRLASSPAYNIPISPALFGRAERGRQSIQALNASTRPMNKTLGVPVIRRRLFR